MATYRTRAEIDFKQPVVIQQRVAAGQFSDTVPADTNLVVEDGIWKYPAVAAAGAIDIPNTVRLVAILADLGSSSTWTAFIKGNPSNTTGEPYPSGSAALYLEGTVVIGTGSATQYITQQYASGTGPILMPGQRLYLVTTGATNPVVRVWFQPYT
jgi:hypothetical protein